MTHGRHRLFDAKLRDGWHTYMDGVELRKSWHGSLSQLVITAALEAIGGMHKAFNETLVIAFDPSPYTLDSLLFLQRWCIHCHRYHSPNHHSTNVHF